MEASTTAVVLIEFQNEFCKEGGKLHDLVKAEMERRGTLRNAQRLQRGARRAGALVVMAPYVFDEEVIRAWRPEGIVAGGIEGGTFRPGAWGTKIIDELEPQAGDAVVRGKCGIGAFAGTNLDQLLRSGGVRNVVVCGFLTNFCVESTVRDAYDRGFRVVVARDACCAATPEESEYPETRIFPQFGKVSTVDEVLEALG